LDQRDGFLHFSTGEQLEETARLYYKGARDIFLLTCKVDAFPEVKFEPSKSGSRKGLFPHVYGELDLKQHVLRRTECPLGLDDLLLLPPLNEDDESPPSIASSGCPSPPSSGDECMTPPSPPSSPPPEVAETCEDPPLLPVAAPPAMARGSEQGPFQPQNTKPPSVSELLLFAFALVQVFVFFLAEMDSFTSATGVGLIGALSGGWLALGLLCVVKCPVKIVAKAQLVAAVLSIFFCSKVYSFLLLFSCSVVVGLLSIPLWMIGALDMLAMFVQRHRTNRT
jgi:uncharacterized protein (DUF952 family)